MALPCVVELSWFERRDDAPALEEGDRLLAWQLFERPELRAWACLVLRELGANLASADFRSHSVELASARDMPESSSESTAPKPSIFLVDDSAAGLAVVDDVALLFVGVVGSDGARSDRLLTTIRRVRVGVLLSDDDATALWSATTSSPLDLDRTTTPRLARLDDPRWLGVLGASLALTRSLVLRSGVPAVGTDLLARITTGDPVVEDNPLTRIFLGSLLGLSSGVLRLLKLPSPKPPLPLDDVLRRSDDDGVLRTAIRRPCPSEAPDAPPDLGGSFGTSEAIPWSAALALSS